MRRRLDDRARGLRRLLVAALFLIPGCYGGTRLITIETTRPTDPASSEGQFFDIIHRACPNSAGRGLHAKLVGQDEQEFLYRIECNGRTVLARIVYRE